MHALRLQAQLAFLEPADHALAIDQRDGRNQVPAEGKLSEPLCAIIDHAAGKLAVHSLGQRIDSAWEQPTHSMTVLIQNPFIRRMRQRIRSIQAVLLLLALLGAGRAAAQLLPAYALFNAQGGKVSHRQMLRTVADADVVLFGEEHNNPIAHWLQLEVARDLAARGPLVLGAEMIEADDQVTLDRYLRGEIDSAAFDTLARLWKNHATDYAPLVKLAKDRQLPSWRPTRRASWPAP